MSVCESPERNDCEVRVCQIQTIGYFIISNLFESYVTNA
jgi:hypothetical protein